MMIKAHLLRSPPRLSLRRTFKYASLGLVGRLASETFLFVSILIPASAGAFSDGFKKQMTSIQEKVMLDGKRFTAKDAKVCWEKFDEEVLSLLSQGRPNEHDLNKATARLELSVYDSQEEESIELGTIEAQFFRLDSKGRFWLVAFSNSMLLPTSTFHLYKKVEGKFVRVGTLEEVKGPWDLEKVIFSTVQIQLLSPNITRVPVSFTSLHNPPHPFDQNRSQIVWEPDPLKAVTYYPEVDWHLVEGEKMRGRGEAFPIP